MRSILEKAIVHLLNEENDQAEALFHKFMVAKARQIHESLRTDDFVPESFDDINSDEMFTEDDLNGLEDKAEGDDVAADDDFNEFGGVDDAAADDAEIEAAGDTETADGDIEDAADDIEDDLDADAEGEGEVEDRIADLEAQIAKLTAEFEAEMGSSVEDEDDAEFGADDLDDDMADEGEGEVDADLDADETDDMADAMDNDMQDDVKESDESDEFDDITESVVSELEKVMVSMTDGKEIGAGKSFDQNNTSPALQKKPNPMTDGKPVSSKGGEHKSFERETAPSVKDMKKRKNTKSKGDEGQSSVSKEGDKSALINKTPGAEAQTKSPLAKR